MVIFRNFSWNRMLMLTRKTGGGGGGSGAEPGVTSFGGRGGSGVVVVRYQVINN